MQDRLSLDSSIDDLDVTVRTYNVLRNMNLETLRDVVQCTEQQLLKERNFGRKSLSELKFELAMHGLRLGMPLPDPDQLEVLTKKLDDLSNTVFMLSMKLKNHIASQDKLIGLHNEMARSVAKMEGEGIGVTTLRDQFAMAALPALIQNKSIKTTKDAADYAYATADAMLEVRKDK